MSGAVVDEQGRRLAGVYVRAFQADAAGRYSNETRAPVRPRLCGVVRTDSAGRYSFETIRPGSYPDSREPAHIHFMVFGSGVAEERLLLQFEGDPFLNGRRSGDRTATIRPVARRGAVEHCQRDLRVRR